MKTSFWLGCYFINTDFLEQPLTPTEDLFLGAFTRPENVGHHAHPCFAKTHIVCLPLELTNQLSSRPQWIQPLFSLLCLSGKSRSQAVCCHSRWRGSRGLPTLASTSAHAPVPACRLCPDNSPILFLSFSLLHSPYTLRKLKLTVGNYFPITESKIYIVSHPLSFLPLS